MVKIVKFKGGLGNQLFQYSFLRTLQVNHNCGEVKADLSYYTDLKNDKVRVPRIKQLNIKFEEADEKDRKSVCFLKHIGNPQSLLYKASLYFEKTINGRYYFESNRSYRDPNRLLKYDYYDGYWQSWRYLEGIEDILREEITPSRGLSKRTEETISKLKNENAVFLGIRRGDYLESAYNRKHYGSFNIEYYTKAIEHIKSKIENPIFYIFSNDINWVKDNMEFNANVVYRDDEEQISDVEELFIMASCKHAIIVNSTFYWWGAWLINNQDKIIIAPSKWFADDKPIDIIPDTWIKF